MNDFVKFPRTPHLKGSKLQDGDADLEQIDLASLHGGTLVWEEKVDGANAALSFLAGGELQLQSRGHVLRGGAREGQFALFKAWAETHQDVLRAALSSRYIVYGEWCYAKHTVFYDRLPHYFLEFDIFDRAARVFLSTPARRALLNGLPIVSVPVVHVGPPDRHASGGGSSKPQGAAAIRGLIEPSLFKSSDWRQSLARAAIAEGQDPIRVARETDDNDRAEGVYLKHEDGLRVIGRYKFIRADFLQSIAASGSHWQERPIIPNGLAPGVDLFAWDGPS